MSNKIKSWLFNPGDNIIQEIVRTGTAISTKAEGPQTVLSIPVSALAVKDTVTCRLKIYDENWENLPYLVLGEPDAGTTKGTVILIFKDAILWMTEYKFPAQGITRINEDTFKIELKNFGWYVNEEGDPRYAVVPRGKLESAYLQILHGPNVIVEFSIGDEAERLASEKYVPVEEWTQALYEHPWKRADKQKAHTLERLKTLDSWIGHLPYERFDSKIRNNFILFEADSDTIDTSRFAIYDKENHKWILDCLNWWDEIFFEIDEKIDIDTTKMILCKEIYNETLKALKLQEEKESWF